MKILLFATPFENTSKKEGSYPLGLAYLASVLEKKHSVKVYDFLFENWKNLVPKLANIIKSEKPDMVGITSMTTNRTSSFKLARLTKKINPNIKVVMGGVHPTLLYEQIVRNFPVDFVVVGEGEETAAELVEAIEKKKALSQFKKIKGIAFMDGDEFVKTETRPFIKNLDSLPMPNHLHFRNEIIRGKTFYLTSSRGCPFSCTFCSTSRHWGRMIRRRSPEKVVEELKFLKKEFPEINYAIFNDDEFVINPEWIKEFCNLLLKEKLDITWSCAARVTSVNEEVVKLIKSAGCVGISLGLESGSPKIIKYMNKCITLEQVSKAFSICRKYGLRTYIFLMVGLPGEDSRTINETIEFTKTLPLELMYLPSVYHVFPGTQTYELAKKQGFISDDYWLTEKLTPFYTHDHSKMRLMWWSIKIALFWNLNNGKLFELVRNMLIASLHADQIRRIIRRYVI